MWNLPHLLYLRIYYKCVIICTLAISQNLSKSGAMEVRTARIICLSTFCNAKRKEVCNMPIEKKTIDKGLLLHWWHYYGKAIYTFDELMTFDKIIDEYGADKVLDVAVASFIMDDGSPTRMLMSIRANKVKELFESLPDFSKQDEEVQEQYNAARNEFVEIISKTASA